MFTMMTVIRKRPEVSTEDFRRFMELEYGTSYVELPQTREYVQYYLDDVMTDGAEDPIDAIVHISFESQEEMRHACRPKVTAGPMNCVRGTCGRRRSGFTPPSWTAWSSSCRPRRVRATGRPGGQPTAGAQGSICPLRMSWP
ncbi:hypothetical protein BJ970_000848 [Saccharopolyspora phatthalungensis]|uniref:EthD domain-containing protein n=1 Tax=Saccharopolyspora phatthalungensis TaxID=664693 RepID=A0A840PZA1_9PSEU|nr:hypothetical protein [Saccharopolyspora phatthalungensis]